MTTESTQPQPDLGPAPDNGQVQSQGHRRRRRRRKNKSSQQGAQPNQPAAQQAQPQQPAPPQPAPHTAPHQTRGRNKKNFCQKTAGPPPTPANKRKGHAKGKPNGRQKGP